MSNCNQPNQRAPYAQVVNTSNMYSIDRINRAIELMENGIFKEAEALIKDEPMAHGLPPITKTNPPSQEEMRELEHAMYRMVNFAAIRSLYKNRCK